ncbi:transcriptional regulator ATRX homolog [Anabrus simplex]|uniref:transcriptional regulator ATRX homolog n=1 Tax=Anabrus simplex TaxID=316456 RepID=UPI0035A3D5A8
MEYWRHVVCADESRFQLYRADGRVRVWRMPHEAVDPPGEWPCEKCARYKMELIESSNNSRKMVVKKIPIIFPSSPQSSPKRDRLTRKSQIQKFIVDLPVEKEQSNLSKDTEVVKSVEKPKRKSLDLKLKTNDISDMLNVDDGDDDIDTIELSDEEDAGEQRESKSKKKSEEKSRKTPMKDKAAVEEKDKGKSREVTAKLDAWLARIATMPLEKVDNKPSRRWENSAKVCNE